MRVRTPLHLCLSARPSSIAAFTLALAGVLGAGGAWAQVSCGVSAIAVAFGAYNPVTAAPTYSTGQVNVTCTKPSPPPQTVNYTVALSTGASGSYAARTMIGGTPSGPLQYNLFVSPPPSLQIWGNGTAGTLLVAGSLELRPPPPLVANATHTVYGTIPALQDVSVGAYIDTIVVTLNF